MKKKLIVLFACATMLTTACSANDFKDSLQDVTDSISNSNSATAAPTATPAPKAKTLALGKKATVGDWKFTVKKCSVKKKIKNGTYRYFEASKGEKFMIFKISVRNNGKKENTFLPRVGYENTTVMATLYYKDKYEYQPTQLLSYDKDIVTKKIQPLSTKNGVIAFKVPNKVAKGKKQVKLRLGTTKEYVEYKLK